ncbi:MAG TPA: hypothetical protein VM187_07895, partial [Niastella sp.]|nr:hypothetical protein [Niastella sp.]
MRTIFGRLSWCLSMSFLALFIGNVTAQQTKVTLKVSNIKKEAVPFASLTIVPVSDTTKALNSITDSSGIAIIELPYGHYDVSVSSVNYLPFKKGINIIGELPVFVL